MESENGAPQVEPSAVSTEPALDVLDRDALDRELALCGFHWTEPQRKAVVDMGLLPAVGERGNRQVPAVAVALLETSLLTADARAIAEARGRASLVGRTLFEGDAEASAGVRAMLRARLVEEAVLGLLGEQLALWSDAVLDSLRGAARREWRMRQLLLALDGMSDRGRTGITGRHAVPRIAHPEEVVVPPPPVPDEPGLSEDSQQTIPVQMPRPPQRSQASAPLTPGSTSTQPIPRATAARPSVPTHASGAQAIPEGLRYLQASAAARRAMVERAAAESRLDALEAELAKGRRDDVDAFRLLAGDVLVEDDATRDLAPAFWERVIDGSAEHAAAALARLASTAVDNGDAPRAAALVETLAVECRDPELLAETIDRVVSSAGADDAPRIDEMLLHLSRLRVLGPTQTAMLHDRLLDGGDQDAWVEVARTLAMQAFDPDAAVAAWLQAAETASERFGANELAISLTVEGLDTCGRHPLLARALREFAERADDLDAQRHALTLLSESDDAAEALPALALLASLATSMGDEDGATRALERILDKVPPSGAGAEQVHQQVLDVLASVDRPDLRVRWLKRRAAAASDGAESYGYWAEIVTTLHGLPGYAGELATAIDMALTLASDFDVDPREVLRLHALGLAAKARAPRWESAAWHAAQVCDRRAAMDTETAALLLEAVERAGGSVSVSAEALGVLQTLAEHAPEIHDARIVFGIGHGLLRAHQWEAARDLLERLVQRDPATLPQDVKARSYADLARVYEKLNAARGTE